MNNEVPDEDGLDPRRHPNRAFRHDGREAATARPVSRRLKALFAVIALVLNGGLAILAWNAGVTWLALVLTGIAVFLAADLAWLSYQLTHHVGSHEAHHGGTHA